MWCKAELYESCNPVALAVHSVPLALVIARKEILKLEAERSLTIELVSYIAHEDVRLLISVVLERVEQARLPLLVPLTLNIEVDISPIEHTLVVEMSQFIERIEGREVNVEVPIAIAIILTTVRVAQVNLTTHLAVAVHLIWVEVSQHIGVLTSQSWEVVDCITATLVDSACAWLVDVDHRYHTAQCAECTHHAECLVAVTHLTECSPTLCG